MVVLAEKFSSKLKDKQVSITDDEVEFTYFCLFILFIFIEYLLFCLVITAVLQ